MYSHILFSRTRIVLLLAGSSLWGATYTYTKIVDNAPGSTFALSPFSGPFLVNGQGVVAFSAQHSDAKGDTVYGIYSSSGGAITTIVEDRVKLTLTGLTDSGTVVYVKG